MHEPDELLFEFKMMIKNRIFDYDLRIITYYDGRSGTCKNTNNNSFKIIFIYFVYKRMLRVITSYQLSAGINKTVSVRLGNNIVCIAA